jgi:RHS repeat-associated protein
LVQGNTSTGGSNAFGAALANQDPDANSVATIFNLRFPGQQFDAATALNYNYFRDYESATGRYVESDPVGLDGGLNTFGYVSSNPGNRVDPSGLMEYSSGRWIDCGKGCRIRIDFKLTYDGTKIRHLHWECKGSAGECGEFGETSHGGTWEDAPSFIQQCALRNGFAGANAPTRAERWGGIIAGFLYWAFSEGSRIVFPPRNAFPIP